MGQLQRGRGALITEPDPTGVAGAADDIALDQVPTVLQVPVYGITV